MYSTLKKEVVFHNVSSVKVFFYTVVNKPKEQDEVEAWSWITTELTENEYRVYNVLPNVVIREFR